MGIYASGLISVLTLQGYLYNPHPGAYTVNFPSGEGGFFNFYPSRRGLNIPLKPRTSLIRGGGLGPQSPPPWVRPCPHLVFVDSIISNKISIDKTKTIGIFSQIIGNVIIFRKIYFNQFYIFPKNSLCENFYNVIIESWIAQFKLKFVCF